MLVQSDDHGRPSGAGGRAARAARALVLEAPGTLVQRELVRPPAEPGGAWLRVEACGLCGTDHEQWSGELFGGFAFVPGHETVGVVDELGPGAGDGLGVAVGQRVAVEVFRQCGRCAACTAGSYNRCEHHGIADMYGFVPVATPPGLWGGYAEYQYVAPDSRLLTVPDGLGPVDATLFNPVGAGIRWAVTMPGTQPGDIVAVLGPGVRGLAAAAAAREAGAGFVMVTGVGPGDVPRLALASRFGADLAVDVVINDPVRVLRDATGRGADVVVDVTAKAPAAFAQAVALARPGGTVVVAGTRGSPDHGASGAPGFAPDAVVFKELRILGALGVDTASCRAALALVASGRYPFAELPCRVAGFGDLAALLGAMGGTGDPSAEPRPVHGVFVPDR